MKHTITPFLILGFADARQTQYCKSLLDRSTIDYLEIRGKYKGTRETGVLIPCDTWSQYDKYMTVLTIAHTLKQDCILRVTNQAIAYLDYLDDRLRKEKIGYWREIPERVAQTQDNYTVINDLFYQAY